MKARQWRLASGLALACLIGGALGPAAEAAPEDAIDFDSYQLESCVRQVLGIASPAPVTVGAMETLTSLDCFAVEVSSMEDLAAAKNLESLSLPSARSADWSALASLKRLTVLDLESSDVGSLAWMQGFSSLVELTLDGTSPTDLEVLEELPLERLSVRSMGLADIDFLSGHPTLRELNFGHNDVDDLSVLQTLPALEKVSLDGNRAIDVSPLAGLHGLSAWSALDQRGTLPALEACVQHSGLTGGTGIDGSAYQLVATAVPNDLDSFVVPFNGLVTLVTRNSDERFSARFEVESYGYESPCPWPESYLPSIQFPTQLLVGNIATIGIAEWGTRMVHPSYKWTFDDGTVASSTASIVPLDAGIGTTVTPSATTRADGMQTVVVTGPTLTIFGTHPDDATFAFASEPTVGLTPELLPDRSWNPAAINCKWLLDGVTVSTSANCGWVVPSSAAGKELSVEVTVLRTNYADKTYTVAPATVLRAFTKSAAGHLSGTPDVGKSLSVVSDSTGWSPTPASRTYQWLRNGVPISGASGSTYKLQTADAGKSISVEVTGNKAGYRSVTIETNVITVRKLFTTKPTPAISGTPTIGSKLAVKRGTWSPTPSSYAYQWYRNGKAISGATKSTYTTKSTDYGAKITVKVTAKRSGYTTASKTSAAATILKRFTTTRTPTITGTAKVKNTLTAKPGTWSPSATFTYQWYRNGKAISGATARTYRPGVRDAYASITVKVTGKRGGYLSVAKTSSAKRPVGIKYSTCTALKRDYPGGVAKSSTTKNKVKGVAVEGIRADTFVSSGLYTLNAARDADKDGWACE